jgi:hypothetical protein
MKNIDVIRAMDAEEMAKFLSYGSCDKCGFRYIPIVQKSSGYICFKTENHSCSDGILLWLESEEKI